MSSSQMKPSVTDDTEYMAKFDFWKTNSPFLYDNLLVRSLEYPAHVFEWLPSTNSTFSFILGTNIDTDVRKPKSKLIQATVALPESIAIDTREAEQTAASCDKFLINEVFTKNEVIHSISRHPCLDIICTSGTEINVYHGRDLRAPVSSFTDIVGIARAHSLHPTKELVATGDDCMACVWDISRGSQSSSLVFTAHVQPVTCLSWLPRNDCCFISGSISGAVFHNDTRTPTRKGAALQLDAGLRCIEFVPGDDNLFVSAGQVGAIELHDQRYMATCGCRPIHSMKYSGVTNLRFKPNDIIFATAGNEGNVMLFDLSKINQPSEDDPDVPGEVMFQHGGHTKAVTDVRWCPDEDNQFMVASAGQDNLFEVWEMSNGVHSAEELARDLVNAEQQSVQSDGHQTEDYVQ
eukprot:TRINITY_DN15662_c0_g1_i1.p1 TRINITY_DN15662_c0_g1~~TRINITY_DN15662_c0_g1_i1.p1  ORF type:complete len:406 (-),score=100.46 TRINITY_DN15662_c0_g1_i1:110-1327(-)